MNERDNQLIGPLAAFVGARLQHPNPEINGQGNPWVSTILVEQYKEKFWYARVYCKLAWPALVKQKWQWLKDNKELMSKRPARYSTRIDVTADEPTDEFFAACVKRDALYYREVYRDAVALQPHLKSQICSQADYTELLFDSYLEIETWLDKLVQDEKKAEAWLSRFCELYRVPNVAALKAFMKTVYEPTFKDIAATSG